MIALTDVDELRETARESIDSIAARPGPRKLCQALALSEGFSFQIAVCSSPQASAALQLWLARAVAAEREASVSTERISPYPLDWRIPGPASIRVDELVELVLGSLVGPQRHADLVFLDAARTREDEADAWRWLFERLNERRNLIVRDLRAALTLILPPGLEVGFARAAPDLWSIRSVSVRDFESIEVEASEVTGFSSDVEILTPRRPPRPLRVTAYLIDLANHLPLEHPRGFVPRAPFRDSISTVVDLAKAIEKLPAPLREIILWRMADYSIDEIASELGLNHSTVRMRHDRALQMLRSTSGEEHDYWPSR